MESDGKIEINSLLPIRRQMSNHFLGSKASAYVMGLEKTNGITMNISPPSSFI